MQTQKTPLPPKINASSRRRARRFALQAIYQWQLTQDPISPISERFLQQEEMISVDTAFFQRLLQGVTTQQKVIDQTLQPLLDRSIQALDQIELAILRIGTYELLACPDIPCRIILNEAIELAKVFGTVASHKYVNGVLHHLAKQIRQQDLIEK